MSLYTLRYLGDPVLRQKSKNVEDIDGDLQKLIDDMFETMYWANGVGLAAPQIGISKRLAVLDTDIDNQGVNKIVIINPTIVDRSGTIDSDEGCLSIPEISGTIERSESVILNAYDREGKELEIEAKGNLLARALQHEVDHLDGMVFIDRMGQMKRAFTLKKWKKIKKDLGAEEA